MVALWSGKVRCSENGGSVINEGFQKGKNNEYSLIDVRHNNMLVAME